MFMSSIKLYFAILLSIFFIFTSSLSTSHTWKGYSPSCEQECRSVGDICDIGKEIICCMKDKCSSKFGLTVCEAPLVAFNCNPIP